MSHSARREYFIAILGRYQKASREGKGRILDEFCKVCGYSRNYAIRKLQQSPDQPRRKAGRKPLYEEQFTRTLLSIWMAMFCPCSKKLVSALPHWLKHRVVEPEIYEKLLKVSPATVDRLLRPYRNKRIRGKSLTHRTSSYRPTLTERIRQSL